jgi:hypothetical protein
MPSPPGAVRRYLSSRISIGPEFVLMSSSGQDRNMMLTGNVVFDAVSTNSQDFTPFIVVT